MLTFTSSVEEKMNDQSGSGLAAPYDERLQQVASAMVKSCVDLRSVLMSPAQEYGVLAHFLVRAVGGSEFRNQMDATAANLGEVSNVNTVMRLPCMPMPILTGPVYTCLAVDACARVKSAQSSGKACNGWNLRDDLTLRPSQHTR